MADIIDINLDLIIDGEQPTDIDALLKIVDARSDYPLSMRRLLSHSSRAYRVFGLVRLANEFAGGSDTALACSLADRLVQILIRDQEQLGFENGQFLPVLGSLVSSYANSLFQEGRFEEAVGLVGKLPSAVPDIRSVDGYWNAVALSVRGLARQFDVVPACSLLDSIPDAFQHVPHYTLAQSGVEGILQKRFEVPERHTLFEQHAAVWFNSVDEQITSLEAIREDFARVPPESERFQSVDKAIGEAIEELRRFSTRFDDYTDTRSLRVDMIGTFKRFNAVMRQIQNLPAITGGVINMFHVDQIIEESQWHIELGTASDEHYANIDRCFTWCQQSQDIHGQLMLAWSAALLAIESDQEVESRSRLKSLVVLLTDLIDNAENEDSRGGYANFFYDLPGKVYDQFRHEDIDEIVRATELRKNRSLLSMSSLPSRKIDYTTPSLLGAGTHYYALTVLENTDRILSTLYCANGQLNSDELDIPVREIRQSARQLAPQRWSQKSLFGPSTADLPERLRPLLQPLANAMSNGNILIGDHVCVAADDPTWLLPFQYVRLLDGYCIELLSLSRIASFSEALSITSNEPSLPSSGLFVAAPVDEKLRELNDEASARLSQALKSSCDGMTFLHAPIEHESLLEALAPNQLIHINAHGYFPPESGDAFRHAGLLLPESSLQQLRSGAADRILSSADILNANIDLRGSHVSLNACVSGVGLPGHGGDILGLEFALRAKGAASVLATHWDVRWPLSTVFLESFYDNWIEQGLSRGDAWRKVTCELINNPPIDGVRPEEWCAFSLYGDWR